MENNLELLTQKIYDKGVKKAQVEATEILKEAEKRATETVAAAEAKAKQILADADAAAIARTQKAEAEMRLAARQAVSALKQQISGLLSGNLSREMAAEAIKDDRFVCDLLMGVVNNMGGGTALQLLVPEAKMKELKAYVAKQYKEVLDKGLDIKESDSAAFVITPEAGGYKMVFSEAVFEEFFASYLKDLTKSLLFEA